MTEWLRAFVSEPMSFLQQAFFRMVAVLIGLCCHEWGHAYVAWRCGDDTAKKAGRMTLNPFAHLDPFGTLLMLFAGFGYAKPVPVNPNRFRGNRLRADLCVSLAGITVNTILFILFIISKPGRKLNPLFCEAADSRRSGQSKNPVESDRRDSSWCAIRGSNPGHPD